MLDVSFRLQATEFLTATVGPVAELQKKPFKYVPPYFPQPTVMHTILCVCLCA